MQRLKVLGLALVAAFALGAVAASGASAAEPEILSCQKVAAGTGAFEDAKCSKLGGTKEFELKELVKKKFTSTSGAGELKAAGQTVKCAADTNTGEISGTKAVVKVVVKFTKCKLGAAECKSAGANPEEIVTTSLKGRLGYLEKAKSGKVGLELEPEVAGGPFATFKCGLVETKVTGCTIGKITSKLNEVLATATVEWKEVGGKQEWTEMVEGVHKPCELSAFGGKAVLVNTDTVTPEEAAEIKA